MRTKRPVSQETRQILAVGGCKGTRENKPVLVLISPGVHVVVPKVWREVQDAGLRLRVLRQQSCVVGVCHAHLFGKYC